MNLAYIIAGLVAALFYFVKKSSGLSALMQNFKTDQKLAQTDDQIAKNNGLLQAAEQERKAIEDEKPNSDDLVDYFNNK